MQLEFGHVISLIIFHTAILPFTIKVPKRNIPLPSCTASTVWTEEYICLMNLPVEKMEITKSLIWIRFSVYLTLPLSCSFANKWTHWKSLIIRLAVVLILCKIQFKLFNGKTNKQGLQSLSLRYSLLDLPFYALNVFFWYCRHQLVWRVGTNLALQILINNCNKSIDIHVV